MTPPRRKRRPQASSSSAPAQCQARFSPEILPLLNQDEGCRRQETMVLQLELSPIDAGCTHAITAVCRRSRGPPPPTQTRSPARRRGGPRPPPPNLNGSSRRRRPPSPRHGGPCQAAGRWTPATRTSQTRAAHPPRALKPTVHLPWPKSTSLCRRPALRRPHETAAQGCRGVGRGGARRTRQQGGAAPGGYSTAMAQRPPQ